MAPTTSVKDFPAIIDQLENFPDVALDFRSESRVIETLLNTTFALQALYPELVSPVCLIILRELGLFKEEKKQDIIRTILTIAPPDNQTIMRSILEKEPLEKVLNWILENTKSDENTLTRQMSTFFKAIPYRDIPRLLDTFTQLEGIHRDFVKKAVPSIRSRILSTVKPLVRHPDANEAKQYITVLNITGGKQVIPLLHELLPKTGNDVTCLEKVLHTIADTGDRAFLHYIEPYLNHTESTIRNLAVDLISALGGAKSIELLAQQVLNRSLSIEEKKHVLSSLAYIDSPAAKQTIKRFGRPFPFGLKNKELQQLAQELKC